MAWPAKSIDQGNALPVYRYLLTALRDPKRSYRFGLGSRRDTAQAELEALLPEELLPEVLAGNDMIRIKPAPLQAWCSRWLKADDFTRMWRALRQQEYKARHRVKHLALPDNLYVKLSIYAEDEGLTLTDAVKRLLALASKPKQRRGKG